MSLLPLCHGIANAVLTVPYICVHALPVYRSQIKLGDMAEAKEGIHRTAIREIKILQEMSHENIVKACYLHPICPRAHTPPTHADCGPEREREGREGGREMERRRSKRTGGVQHG